MCGTYSGQRYTHKREEIRSGLALSNSKKPEVDPPDRKRGSGLCLESSYSNFIIDLGLSFFIKK